MVIQWIGGRHKEVLLCTIVYGKDFYEKVLVIAYILDILLIVFFSYIVVWWKENHKMPGLAEMLNLKLHLAYLAIEIIVFLVLTVCLIRTRRKCNGS